MILEPIALDDQIIHAIEGYDEITLRKTAEKKRILEENVHRVVAINGKAVRDVEIIDDKVFYRFLHHSSSRYYYPIMYAKIEIR